jgi:hypothetical protein
MRRRGPPTVCSLTPKGPSAIRTWLARPSEYPRIQHAAGVRLAAADLGDERAVVESLRALRDGLPELERLGDEIEERASMSAHRARYIILELSLARRLIQAHRDWVDAVEHTLDPFSR